MQEISKIISHKLKDLFNTGFVLVEEGDYDIALEMFKTARDVSKLIDYQKGIFMADSSIANIYALKEKFDESFNLYKTCLNNINKEMFVVEDKKNTDEYKFKKEQLMKNLHVISLKLLEVGIEHEKSGEFTEALNIYKKIVPYLNEKRRILVEKEIMLLERK